MNKIMKTNNEKLLIWRFDNSEEENDILGPIAGNIKIIESELNLNLILENGQITILDSVPSELIKLLQNIFDVLAYLHKETLNIKERDVISVITMLKKYEVEVVKSFYTNRKQVVVTNEGKPIYVKSITQSMYIDALDKNAITFACGSAGTGKTYLAVAYACGLLRKNKVKKLVITRPVVEAGEKLGFLPGDLKEKIDPYLIPIYDSLYEILGKDVTDKMILKGTIEIAPLAYMRGRTLDNSLIILDEAQNTTTSQMKMFLTRLGFNSKMIVTGDLTQIDLPIYQKSGLKEAVTLFEKIDDIAVIRFEQSDVMRHPLVSKIIEQYDTKVELDRGKNDNTKFD